MKSFIKTVNYDNYLTDLTSTETSSSGLKSKRGRPRKVSEKESKYIFTTRFLDYHTVQCFTVGK